MQRAAKTARSVLSLSVVLLLAGSAGASANLSPGGWDRLGTGATPNTPALNGRVDVLYHQFPDQLYAGGAFTSAGGDATASHIASWAGKSWHALGAPALNGDVRAIAQDQGKLYVGGQFTSAGGNPNANYLAVWDGTSWQPFCNPISATVNALQVIGRKLYIGGDFADGAGLAAADKLVACDLDTGSPSSLVDADGDINSSVLALTADSAGRLYAGGTFINMDQIQDADHVAMYDGAWHAMGAGTSPGGGAIDDFVRSLASDGTNVYVGTDSVDVAAIPTADHVARWNGTAWSALGSNTALTDGWLPASASINAIAVDGTNVYVGGSFQNADGLATADMVARFDGSHWSALGSDGAGNGPLGAPVNALTVFAGQLVAGGNWTSAGGDPLAGYVARYPGVANVLPTPIAPIQNFGYVRYPISSHWSSTDPDGSVVAFRWQWGDGTPDTTGTGDSGYVEHQYATAGTYEVKLTVTDNDGGQATVPQTVVVRVGPKSAFTWTPLRPMVGQTVSFHGAATDVDGTILGYNWYFNGPPVGPGFDDYAYNAGASPTHVFKKAGDAQVYMLSYECDPNACFGVDGNLQTLTVIPEVIPTVTHAAVTNPVFRVGPAPTAVASKVRRGTAFRFKLKAPATVTITIARGKRRAGKLTRAGLQPGANRIPFSGRIGRRALKPGAYKATVSARNIIGKAKPIVVRFRVVR